MPGNECHLKDSLLATVIKRRGHTTPLKVLGFAQGAMEEEGGDLGKNLYCGSHGKEDVKRGKHV